MAKNVDELRRQIDTLDNKLHDLLMKRAELVLDIGKEKRKNNIQIIQPDREIIMLRRLLSRHEGQLPKEAIVRIWRELVGAVSLLQTGLKVAVTVPSDHTGLIFWDMAKDYFSSVLPMQKASNPLSALGMVRENEATFAVVPWPEDDQENPWWGYLLDESGDNAMRIVGRLPLGDSSYDEPAPEHRALLVGRLKFEPSGDDRTFLALSLDQDISRARIVDKASSLDMKALGLHSCPGFVQGRKLHLLEVDGYFGGKSDVSEKLQDLMDDPEARCVSLGGYPRPPVYEDNVGKNAVQPADSKKVTV